MRSFSTVSLLAFLLAACGVPNAAPRAAPSESPAAQEYAATATVLEAPGEGPQLCLGGVAESYPPQCGGPDIVGWDWSRVDGEESANGTTWGDYHVVGTWDGQALTLTRAPGDPEPQGDGLDRPLTSACEPPDGGWRVVDPGKATAAALDAATRYARKQEAFAGLWLDQSINPETRKPNPDERLVNDPRRLVLNVRFTDDLQHHEGELREVWGGALCVVEAERTLAELLSIQRELGGELDGVLSSSVDEVAGIVSVSVTVADRARQEALDDRYGPGVVQLHGRLEPVSD